MKKIISLICFLIACAESFGQNTQTVRGTVTDNQSKSPLIGATVVLLHSSPVLGTASDEDGRFRLDNVPVGRQSFKISYIGYKELVISNIVINTGKEVILNLEMEEEIISGSEIVINSNENKGSTNNDAISISGRVFTIDETNRYAGSLGDPSRMASNFAGVAGGGNDQRNDIVIRGNSPLGLLWRLEGADIPNPNHFSNQGANGGPVSILNNNTLANSDFLTGAWPSEYGNANSGVFDLKMRNGNNEKREYTFQIGFNGVEAMAEGPFKKGRGSYLFSYRYSTLAFFNTLGIQFGESGIPNYQDFSLKIDLPSGKAGTFGLFAIGGLSSTHVFDSEMDSAQRSKRIRPQDIEFSSGMMVAGLTHKLQLGKNAYVRTVISFSGEKNRTKLDTLNHPTQGGEKSLYFSSSSRMQRYSLHSFYSIKLNAKNSLKTGVILSRYQTMMNDSVADWRVNGFRIDYDFNEGLLLGQAYVNWTHRFSNRFVMNAGLHSHMLFLNHTSTLEPRLGLRYQANSSSIFSFGYGLHSQSQPIPVYFERTLLPGNVVEYTNRNLKFTQSHHFVLGYEKFLTKNLRLKSEVYYQYLTNVPVTRYSSVYSVINFGADFGGLPNVDSLQSSGSGRNYGLEITFERFFDKGYYFLITSSFFESKYLASDGIWRNTAFNSNFVINALAGKEYAIRGNNILSLNVKGTYAGGRREIPIDAMQSRVEGRWVNDISRAYEERLPAYFRIDFRIGYKVNRKNLTHEWALDLRNVLNTKNILTRQYNPATGTVEDLYQIGIFPVPLYRLQF